MTQHRDATGLEADLVATLDPVGVRNAEAYVYHRCPDDGTSLVGLGGLRDASPCTRTGGGLA